MSDNGQANAPAQSDDSRLDWLEQIESILYTAVISDALDRAGIRQNAMEEYLRPIHPQCRFAGWARTLTCSDVYHFTEEPYAIEIEAVDSLRPGDVAVVSTHRSRRNAPWGELLSTAAKARGARGAVVDGLVRDLKKIEAISFPVFAAGMKPVDSAGRGMVTAYDVPVECGGVLVQPGDLVVGDEDGIVVVPRAAAGEVIEIALDKVRREDQTRAELAQGAYLKDVFGKYGVL
jgi:4-hydroxy-4-methyl-2-oxoglutarate aldolase